jgi:endonuclease YncB( thermonuclease family)
LLVRKRAGQVVPVTLLWTYPGVVTGPCDRQYVPAELDLGLRLKHPVTVHIAGIAPRRGSSHAVRVQELLPEGTRFVALAARIGHDADVLAHLVLPDGTDIANRIKIRRTDLPAAHYGGRFDKTWRYPATVIRCCDADTIRMRIDLGVPTTIEANIRVAHLNAPETGTAEGQAATVWAERALAPGAQVELHSRGLDKYGRPLAEVLMPDGRDYGQRLIDAGHAVPYEGGKR